MVSESAPTTQSKPHPSGSPPSSTAGSTATEKISPTNPVSPDHLAKKLPQSVQEELIVDWVAPARPYKQHSRQFFSTLFAIALLFIIILIFASQVVFALVIAALGFMAYLLFKIPPGNSYYALTTFGVRVGEALYFWEELGNFWFDKKYDQDLLLIATSRFPHRLTLVIYAEDQAILRQLLSTTLPEFKPQPTLYEKWASWLAKTFPLEAETQTNKVDQTQQSTATRVQGKETADKQKNNAT